MHLLLVHGAKLPVFWVAVDAHYEMHVLFVGRNGRPGFDQDDPEANCHLLEFRRSVKKVLIVLPSSKGHHYFHAGPFVQATVA